MSTTSKLTSAVPQLPSGDLAATRELMVRRLGFECVAEYDDLVILRRDNAEVHFWLCPDADLLTTLAQNSSCYIRVDNIEPLFLELKSSGLEFAYELEDKPWGTREMQVNLPGGNALRFGELLA